jgi:ribose transport system substrate-binding protein
MRPLAAAAALSAAIVGLAACSSSTPAASGTTSASTAATGAVAATGSAASSGSYVTAAAAALQLDYKGTSEQPPSSAPKVKGAQNIWIISCGQEAEGCSRPVSGAVAAAQALGWKAKVFDGQFGADDAFNTGIRQAVAAKATAILLIGIDCNQAKAGLQVAKTADIPVLGANSFDCNDPALNAGPPLFAGVEQFVSTTPTSADLNEAVGAAKADWLIVHTDGKAKVIEVGLTGLTGYYYENLGFAKELAKCSGCSIVGKALGNPTDLSNGVLQQSFSSTLTANPEANAVMADGDSIVTGAEVPQALQSAGRVSSVLVIGSEGFTQNLDLIRQNRGQNAAVPFDELWVGWGLVDETLRVLAKQPLVDEGMGFQVVDTTHNMPAAGQNYTDPINFIAAYEKAWGVSG